MIVLDRYIAFSYLKGMVPVMLLLLGLFSLLALTEELEEVGNGTFRLIDAFGVVFYTSPRRIVDLMPVTALLGGLMGLGALANHQELMAARAAGLSKARMARPVFEATLVLAALVVLMQSLLVDDAGKLKTLIQADQAAIIGDDTWLLEGVTRTRLSDLTAREDHIESTQWTNLLSQEQAEILILPLEALAPHDLVLYIRHLQDNDLDTHHFRVIFWKQVSIAIAVIAMGLLSLPLLVGSTRAVSASQRIIVGGLIGIVFYLLQQVTGHLAGLFRLVPSLTILTPVFLLLVISVGAQFWRGFSKPAPASGTQPTR
jgi:lipopolysaccharide export system permease protein